MKRALRFINRGDIERGLDELRELLEENENDPGAQLILSQLIAVDTLNIYNLDSALVLINGAMADYGKISPDEVEDLSKLGIDSIDFYQHRLIIQERSVERAFRHDNIRSYEQFLGNFPDYPEIKVILRKRDSIAYHKMRSEKASWSSFASFIKQYPTSDFRDQAEEQYHKLLYHDKTKANVLGDYQKFLNDFPETPFRAEIEQIIFDRATAYCDMAAYCQYATDYPESDLAIKAMNMLYYLEDAFDCQALSMHPAIDSLIELKNADKHRLITIMEDGKFGFMSPSGAIRFPPELSFVAEDYLCTPLEGNVVFGKRSSQMQLFTSDGHLIFEGEFFDVQDLGAGVLRLEGNGTSTLLHRSGFVIMEEVEDATLLDKKWIKIRKDGMYGLYSLSGYPLTISRYTDIRLEGEFWVFERAGQIAVTTQEEILGEINESGISLEFKFDDYELVNDSMMIGFNGERECLLGSSKQFLIPWGNHEVYPDPFFYYTKDVRGYHFFNPDYPEIRTKNFSTLLESETWLGLKTTDSWTLLNKSSADIITELDSVRLMGDFGAYTLTNNVGKLFFTYEQQLEILSDHEIEIIASPNRNKKYLILTTELNKTVWDDHGRYCFSGDFEEISCLNDTLFTVTLEGQRGVINRFGEELLPLEYDLIQSDENLLFLLKNSKIGAFDLSSGAVIQPIFESRLKRIGNFYLTQSSGRYGLIDSLSNHITSFEYQEIRQWNDTSVWARTDSTWQLLAPQANKILLENVQFIKRLHSTANETYIAFYSHIGYGIASNISGVILPPKFNDIKLYAPWDNPIFLVEQSLPVASYYVLLYVNGKGKVIRSMAYRPEEYELIYCDN
ncbi:MAG: hypothetical protein KI790_04705 [Cyclobacteriaceae bacterium]|nr:hypothetical protein [Cyclobacteriaceae bacterium HetDA_MAG_MS6]